MTAKKFTQSIEHNEKNKNCSASSELPIQFVETRGNSSESSYSMKYFNIGLHQIQ